MAIGIVVLVRQQQLIFVDDAQQMHSYRCSTSRFGFGDEIGSFRTPLGHFIVHSKWGHEHPNDSILESRTPPEGMEPGAPKTEHIVSRALWLQGVEAQNANTFERYIYLHGTDEEEKLGTPASMGGIRLSQRDIIELYEMVDQGTPVLILDQ